MFGTGMPSPKSQAGSPRGVWESTVAKPAWVSTVCCVMSCEEALEECATGTSHV